MRAASRTLLAALALLLAVAATARAQVGDRESQAELRDLARRLIFSLEYLQEDILIADLGRQRREVFYHKTDDVLHDAQDFLRQLRPGIRREHLLTSFAAMEKKLLALLVDVYNLERTPALELLQVTRGRIRNADEQLHLALVKGDTSDERGRQDFVRQAGVMLSEARQLRQVVPYAVASPQNAARLVRDVDTFTTALQNFVRVAEGPADRQELRREFAVVDRSWDQLARAINVLATREGQRYLRNRAERIDDIEEYLERRLGLEGGRARVLLRD